MHRERRTQKQQQEQQQGVNWGLLVGGAVATVLSVAFSRSKKKKTRSKQNAASMEAETLSLRRESSSGSSCSGSSKSEISEGDEILSAFNRTAIQRLRHQLKSRDQMIMEMQSQLTDKERALFSNKSLVSNLEKQLRDANQSVFEVERVIQDLREPQAAPKKLEQEEEQGVVAVKKDGFGEEELEQDYGDRSIVLHAKEGEYGLVFEKAKHLEAELVGIRAMAQEMASLLELSERERLRLHHVVSQLQQKLAFQAKELNTMRATTHFLKLSVGSTRRSGGEIDGLSRQSKDEDGGLIQLNSSTSVFSNAQERYAAASESVDKMEISEMDASVKEDNSTSSSASSFPEFSDATEWSAQSEAEEENRPVEDYSAADDASPGGTAVSRGGFRTDDSPNAVRIGSPTIVGSRSLDGFGLAAARRYLFDPAATTEEQQQQQDHLLEVVVEEQKSSQDEASSSCASSVTDEMLDDTLDDLVNATTPRRNG